jgi:hypothetical protein
LEAAVKDELKAGGFWVVVFMVFALALPVSVASAASSFDRLDSGELTLSRDPDDSTHCTLSRAFSLTGDDVPSTNGTSSLNPARRSAPKKKKWYQKIGSALKNVGPIISGIAAPLINTVVPGAGTLIQGLMLRGKEKTVTDVGNSIAGQGVGEFVSSLLFGKESTPEAKAEEAKADQATIRQAMGEAPGILDFGADPAARAGAAAVGAGAGFLVLGPAGAAAGALAGAVVGPTVFDKVVKLFK